ncbi:ATP-binding protein [Nonomuraea sp. NPDC003201]
MDVTTSNWKCPTTMAGIGIVTDKRFLGKIVLPGTSASVPVARHCVAQILKAAGHEDVYGVQVAVSELVSNAYLHSASQLPGGRIIVKIADMGSSTAYVEVVDAGSATVPCPRVTDTEECTGRGLWLVSRLSARWGVRESGPGRGVVWMEVPTSPEDSAATMEDLPVERDIAPLKAEF